MALRESGTFLSDEQKRRFKRDGFLVIRDAFDEEVIDEARDVLWDAIPESRDDPESWFERDGDHDEILHRGSDSQSGENLSTVEPFEQVFRDIYPYAEQLVGEDVLAAPDERPAQYTLHGGHLMASREGGESIVDHDGAVGPILQYPANLDDPLDEPYDYRWQRHVDGGTGPYATEDDDVEYLPFTIASAVYFDEVVPRGGGFTVWPGSHRKVPQYFENHTYGDYIEGRLTPMADEDEDVGVLESLDLGPAFEINGDPGTLVLWHHNIAHGAAPNHSDRIRMAGFQRISRKDIGEIGQRALSDPWLQYDAIRDLEPTHHRSYDTYRG